MFNSIPPTPPIDEWGYMPHHIGRNWIFNHDGTFEFAYYDDTEDAVDDYNNHLIDTDLGVPTTARRIVRDVALHTLN